MATLLRIRHPRPDTRPARMPASIALVAAFGADLVFAALVTAAHVNHTAGIVALAVIAGVLSWWSALPGALGVGVLGWLFYSGFVAHADGQLGVTGPRDLVVLAVLAGTVTGAVGVRSLAQRCSAAVTSAVGGPSTSGAGLATSASHIALSAAKYSRK
jgi:hypothetical protein